MNKFLNHRFSNIALAAILTIVIFLWNEYLHQHIAGMYCFMDAILWRDATEYVHNGQHYYAAGLDRPPLYLFMSSALMNVGFPTAEAMQLLSRISLALSFGFTFWILSSLYDRWAAMAAILLLFWCSPFNKLSVWVNAQAFYNALCAIHFAVGFHLAHSQRKIAWITLGLVASLCAAAKEQGLLLLPCSLLYLTFIPLGNWKQRITRCSLFILGTLPILIWLWEWGKAQLKTGEKWQIFSSDTQTLTQNTDWSQISQAQTTWGSFSGTFGESENYIHMLSKAWPHLLREINTHFTAALALLIFTLIWSRKSTKDWSSLLWIFSNVAAMLPLMLFPIFEPYHYAPLEIPTIACFAWCIHSLLQREHPDPSKKYRGIGLLFCCISIGAALRVGMSFPSAITGELGGCVSGRIRPVLNWTENTFPMETKLYFTDSMILLDKTLQIKPVDYVLSPEELPPNDCSELAAVITSDLTAGWNSVRPTLLASWYDVQRIGTINNELWHVYIPPCAK